MARTKPLPKARTYPTKRSAGVHLPTLPDESQLLFEDGEPLESDWHAMQIYLLHEVVNQLYKGRTDYFCGGNMFVYYSDAQIESLRRGRATYKGPDFFVVKNVDGTKPRKAWVVWQEEGRYPDVIIELLSPKTARKDKQENLTLYAQTFGTEEYFWYDPDNDELAGYRLVEGEYLPITPTPEGWLWSKQLGAYIGRWDGEFQNRRYRWIRLYREDGSLVPTKAEAYAQRLRELGEDPDAI